MNRQSALSDANTRLSHSRLLARVRLLLPAATAALAWTSAGAADSVSAQDALRAADEARGNRTGIKWRVVVDTKKNERAASTTFDITARGFDLLATGVAPARNKGTKLLMVNRSMWFHKPGLSKAVPISQRQKLLGNAAYGDIAATNYATDYAVVSSREEQLNDETCYVLDLKANVKRTTYDRITYWVSKPRLVGVKAEYFTVSGKLLKAAEMEYENTVTAKGTVQPFISTIRIRDLLTGNDMTTLRFARPEVGPVPDHVFNLNLLVR